jgi:hypothetical protein
VYCRRFSGDRYDLDEIDELGDAGVALTWRQRTAMLNVYPTPELLQMYAVMRFFRETLKKVSEEDDRALYFVRQSEFVLVLMIIM